MSSATSGGGSAPSRSIRSRSDSPGSSSMTRKSSPVAACPKSSISTTWGELTCTAMRASRRNRSTSMGSRAKAGLSTLMATGRPMRTASAS
jgi:hypothetical protein